MITVIGVSERNQCKVRYYTPGAETFVRGDYVILNTERGLAFGKVCIPNFEIEESESKRYDRIVRRATEEDFDQLRLNIRNEESAAKVFKEKVEFHGLKMKLIRAEYAFDRTRLTFYFSSDGRVDFRELVKDLASVFRTRIELRQIGQRDETRVLGGIGSCGRELCCASWLTGFVPVTIKMPKTQGVSMNSVKISGNCGRLKCCFKNEQDTYEYLLSRLPKAGTTVRTIDGNVGRVKEVKVILQRVVLILNDDKEENEIREYGVEELLLDGKERFRHEDGEEPISGLSEEELKALTGEEEPEVSEAGPEEKKHERRENRDRNENRERRGNRGYGEKREGRSGYHEKNADVSDDETRERRRNRRENGENREQQGDSDQHSSRRNGEKREGRGNYRGKNTEQNRNENKRERQDNRKPYREKKKTENRPEKNESSAE